MKDKVVLCHNGANRTDGKPTEGLLRGQGSSLIPGPRLIWIHPYTRQITVPYCFQFSVRSDNCRV